MIRLALILTLLASSAVAQTVPVPRPEGLVERSRAAAEVSEAVAEVLDTGTDTGTPGRAAIAAQITGAIRACWNVSDLSPEASVVRIRLAFETTPEGGLIRESIEMTEFTNGTQDAAEEALGPAFRAIMRCAEDGLDLPPETHEIWQWVEVQFDAATMRAR